MIKSDEKPFDLEKTVTGIIDHYQAKPTALIMAMQDIQTQFNYLPREVLELVGRKMNLPLAQIYSVATFYKSFSLEPKGKHHICVCTGTACHVRQASVIVDNLSLALGINPRMTTPDREFSFETVNCLGACALGPLVTVNGEYQGKMTVSKMNRLLDEIRGVETEEEPAEEEL